MMKTNLMKPKPNNPHKQLYKIPKQRIPIHTTRPRMKNK